MTTTSRLPEITAERFDADVVQASHTRPVVVDFWAPWCGPCHQLAPLLERVAARFADDIDTVKLNVDEAPAIAQRYRVKGIPAVKGFTGGAVAGELTGVPAESALEQLFSQLAPSDADRAVSAAMAAASLDERERLLREALAADPGHVPATTSLARLLADRGETGEADSLLQRIPSNADVDRLRGEIALGAARVDEADAARLARAADAGDAEAALRLGRALAADGDYEAALERLLAAVRAPATREEARKAVLEVFAVLGDDHPLVGRYRPKLTSALF